MGACAYYFEPDVDLSDKTRIYQVVDGDTFIITGGEYVRLIGVDAPERKKKATMKLPIFLGSSKGRKFFWKVKEKTGTSSGGF